jgi:hypothetical protein
MNRRVEMGLWLGALVALHGCAREPVEHRAEPSAAASAAAPSSASASAGGSASPSASAATGEPTAPPKGPWTPDLWEKMYLAIEGEEPKSGYVPQGIPLRWPSCAHFSGREYLREKFKADFARVTVETNKLNSEREAELEGAALPKRQAWIAAKNDLLRDFKTGVYPVTKRAVSLDTYGAAGSTAKLVQGPEPGVGVSAFQQAFAAEPRASKPFKCAVTHASRSSRALDARSREAFRAEGAAAPAAGSVDQITCFAVEDGTHEIAPYTVAIVLEIPSFEARAKVKVAGDQATIEGYSRVDLPGVDETLRAALNGDPSSLVGKVLEVSGYRKLYRGPAGALGYALLKERNVAMQQAVRTAETGRVWVVSFERACADEGVACEELSTAPSIRVVGDRPPAPAPVPRAPAPVEERPAGRWEAAAIEADPSLPETNSAHDDPWGKGFYAAVVDGAMTLDSYPAPGKPAKLVPFASPASPILDGFRAALAKRGGFEPFECVVADMGEEIDPEPYPLLIAARSAAGKDTAGVPRWNIVCTGDAKSHHGTVVVTVPTDLVWAELEAGNVKGYHLEPQGAFAPELRDKLLDVGVGSKLAIHGRGRLSRSMLKNVVFREERGFPVWRLDLTQPQCPHAGAGCTLQDGAEAPYVRVVKDGLVACPVTTAVYPPK